MPYGVNSVGNLSRLISGICHWYHGRRDWLRDDERDGKDNPKRSRPAQAPEKFLDCGRRDNPERSGVRRQSGVVLYFCVIT